MKSLNAAMRHFFEPVGGNFSNRLKTRIGHARKFFATFATKSFIDRLTASPASSRVSVAALVASMIWATGVLVWGL